MPPQQPRKLVIVESPTKARTISKFLGSDCQIEASMGHVRDLPASADQIPEAVKGEPWARIGVNIDRNFEPLYIIPPEKRRVVSELKEALKHADQLYIATDEDREGESIGWHLLEVLKPKIPTFRMVFHEITPDAIQEALAHPRQLDQRLVQAQEMRRVLDRLVGYVVSPLLWKKIKPKLSAGRVQSAAVRLLVMRERERMVFHSASYWDILAKLSKANTKTNAFDARLVALDGQRIATGKDFDETTGRLSPDAKVLLLDRDRASALQAQLQTAQWRVVEVKRQPFSRSPAPPFTTSTLQQEANRRLGLSAKTTMQVAQKLYESGFITYMRTDSVNLSQQAVVAARELVVNRYGRALLSDKPRVYKTTAKGAQEAHEAIRPAGTQMPTAQQLSLSGDEARLYTMIWQRTVATQMVDAQFLSTTAQIEARAQNTCAAFRASGREIVNPGFLKAYNDSGDTSNSDTDSDEISEGDSVLPPLSEGELLCCNHLHPDEHTTRPPARYTEASLVKALEANGIGRPSTYATIIDTIQRRGYVVTHSKQLVPTFIAMAVARLLEETHGPIVDLAFTAAMEERLDDIAAGQPPKNFLDTFYKELTSGVERGGEIDPRQLCTIHIPKATPHDVRVGRFGPFIEYGPEDARKSVSLPEDAAPADVDLPFIQNLINRAEIGKTPLGDDPKSGLPVFVLNGRFGPYVQLGSATEDDEKPKRQSLPPALATAPENVTLQQALDLLALPRTLGVHPDTQKPIRASIGRFGPYIQHERTFVNLKNEDVLTIPFDRALAILRHESSPEARAKKAEPLKDLGVHPDTQKPVVVLKGRFGPYIKHEDTNASLSKDIDLDTLTLDQALVLLEARAAKDAANPSKKKRPSRTTKSTKTTKTSKTGTKAKKATVAAVAANADTTPPKKSSRAKKADAAPAAADEAPKKRGRPKKTPA